MAPKLPYHLPKTESGRIEFLCRLLDFSCGKLAPYSKEIALQTLTGIVVYHHMERLDKIRFMEFLHLNLRGVALGAAVGKITDPLVNPHWGLWSISTEKLHSDLLFLESISTLLGMAGAGFTVKDLYKTAKNPRSGNAVLTVLIWGFYFNHESSRQAIQRELNRRALHH